MEWFHWVILALVLVCLVAFAMAAVPSPPDELQKPATVSGGGTTVPIQEPWFSLIAEGKKTVEGKPSPESRWAPLIGKTITFQHGDRTVDRVVGAVRYYPDVDSFLAEEWEKTAPQARSLEEAKKLYAKIRMKWRGNPKDGEPDEKGTVQVFSPERVSARGGMTAVELAPPG